MSSLDSSSSQLLVLFGENWESFEKAAHSIKLVILFSSNIDIISVNFLDSEINMKTAIALS